jgi:hypothetical protein
MSRSLLAVLVAIPLTATVAWAQTAAVPRVEKYEDGSIKTQTTTSYAGDGKTKTSEVRTEYDRGGRPLHESHITYRDGVTETQRHERTWVYDDNGRLLYFESSDRTLGTASLPGVETRYRLRKSYDGQKDTTGKTESEEVYSSVAGSWRDFDRDGGDVQPGLAPEQALPAIPGASIKLKQNDEGLPPPPLPRTRIFGKIGWEHTPGEVTDNMIAIGGGAIFGVAPRMSLVAEVTHAAGSTTLAEGPTTFDQSFSRLMVLGGAQWALPAHGPMSPFVRAMAGLAHDSQHFGTASSGANGFVVAIGVGVSFSVRGPLGVFADFDYLPTHFSGTWQQALAAGGGVTYDAGSPAATPGGGSVPVSLENPFASALQRDEAAYNRTKGPNDKAQAELEKCDSEWMKKNLTPEGQKDVAEAKKNEADTKAEFTKAADALTLAERDDARLQTLDSGEKAAKARAALREANRALTLAHGDRIRITKRGFTKAAKEHYEKIFDDHWAAKNKYEETKRDFEKWNKEHGVK